MAMSLACLPREKVRVQSRRERFKIRPQPAPRRHGRRNIDVQHWRGRGLEIKVMSELPRGAPGEAYVCPIRSPQGSVSSVVQKFILKRPVKRDEVPAREVELRRLELSTDAPRRGFRRAFRTDGALLCGARTNAVRQSFAGSLNSLAFLHGHLTVKLRGRTTTPDRRRGPTISLGSRGAKTTTHHGPLQRLLER